MNVNLLDKIDWKWNLLIFGSFPENLAFGMKIEVELLWVKKIENVVENDEMNSTDLTVENWQKWAQNDEVLRFQRFCSFESFSGLKWSTA